MTHSLTLYCLKKLQMKKHMSEDDYDNVCYFLEVFLINLFKSVQIYGLALLLGILLETFVMNCAYVLLRIQAGGWHAKSSVNCSLFGIVNFIGVPLLLQGTQYTIHSWHSIILSLIIFVGVWHYAPSDTEKNPLVSVSERKKKKKQAVFITLLIITGSFLLKNELLRTLLLLGLVIEVLMISPLFYKLMNRRYKNYEQYVEEK
jgi:accessory gene regulator B